MLINVHILDIDVLSLHAFIANWRSYHTCYVVKLLSYQTTNWDLLQHKQTRMFKQPGLGCSKGCLLVPVQGFSSHLFRWFCFVFLVSGLRTCICLETLSYTVFTFFTLEKNCAHIWQSLDWMQMHRLSTTM